MALKLNTLVRKLIRLYERGARECVTYRGDGIGSIRTFIGQSLGGRLSTAQAECSVITNAH